MVREFKLPDVGEGLTEAEIVDWLVEVGDTVSEDQPVAEVETDKAVVEVPSPVNGTVREILAEAGEMVPVGDVIITFDVEGEESEPVEESADESDAESAVEPIGDEADAGAEAGNGATAEAEPSARGGRVFAAPSARRLARELDVDITTVAGSGPGGRVSEADVRAAAESGGDEGAAEAAEAPKSAVKRVSDAPESKLDSKGDGSAEPATTAPAGGPEPAGREQTLAAPATRRLAEEEGVDLNDVPTDAERDGQAFVTPEHVQQYAAAQQAAQAADAQAVQQEAASAPAADTETTPEGEVERVPYRGIRRTIGKAMENSKYTAPHVTHHDTVVVDDLVDVRARLKPKAEERGIKLTYMPFVVKAIVAALKEYPVLNSQLNEDDEEILVKHYHNIGIAVATDAGLMVPVVKDAGQKDMLTIASDVNELASKARDRSISRSEMQGGTFSITNFGAIGGEYATPIINYPETAILGLGELKQRPVVEDGEVVARWTIPISLSIDHRVIDGADAAQFANTLMEYLGNPELLLLE
ncbi:2-oxo acid dehydrogenase subunit E2 [Salinirubellus salinus]|uniref:2-oxo acid dehydrogenase subunit E2 n=1 Tax=Salinirubellus salinus TaxID=1364945 RepID=A0A9E7R2C7_9EURY|nr:2-oxo acid dehydrogenase subunit E2 [Salinirubellus salinus]UWM53558.1 2-oxo acid dehydrogenase subunit E2 [Salinirubellus salinus]